MTKFGLEVSECLSLHVQRFILCQASAVLSKFLITDLGQLREKL